MHRKISAFIFVVLTIALPSSTADVAADPVTDSDKSVVTEPANTDTASTTPSTPSHFMPIIGRIEQIGAPDAKLPLSLTKLQAETPMFDTTQRQPLKANVEVLSSEVEASFPPDIAGRWGGKLTIISEEHKWNGSADYGVGSSGLVVFTFVNDGPGAQISLKPATIFMPTLRKRMADCHFDPVDLAKLKASMKRSGEQLDPEKILVRNPEIQFGRHHSVKLDGSELQVQVTANNLRQLEDGVFEQDIVTRKDHTIADGRDVLTYDESILQFRKTGPTTEFVRAAQVTYGADRSIRRRVIIEGPLSRDWRTYADQISAQTNSRWEALEKRHDI